MNAARVKPARPRTFLPMQDLILLGILMDGPKHGYEIRQLIAQRLGNLATITAGTIYYTLRKVEKRGLVKMTRGREGNRPERLVYALTPKGRDEFRRLLRDAFFEVEHPYTPFDVGFYFIAHASLEDALGGAETQIRLLREFEEHVTGLERAYPVRWPFNLEAIKRHTLATLKSHQAFFQELREDLKARIARARHRRSEPGTRRPAAAPPAPKEIPAWLTSP